MEAIPSGGDRRAASADTCLPNLVTVDLETGCGTLGIAIRGLRTPRLYNPGTDPGSLDQ